jgi:hypothetical protein
MPRRNQPRLRRTPPPQATQPSRVETLDEAALRLVRSGKCSPIILSCPYGGIPPRSRRA